MEDGNSEPTHVLLKQLIDEHDRESQNVNINDALSHYPRIIKVHKLLLSACIDTLPNELDINYTADHPVFRVLNLLHSDLSRTPSVLTFQFALDSGREVSFAEFLIIRLLAAATRLGSVEIVDPVKSTARFVLRGKIIQVLGLVMRYLASKGSSEQEDPFDRLEFIHASIKRLLSIVSSLNKVAFPVAIDVYDSLKPAVVAAHDGSLQSEGAIILSSPLSYLSFVDTVNDILTRTFSQPQSSFLFIDLIPKFITHLKLFCSHTISTIEPTAEKVAFQSNFINICRNMLSKASEQSLYCIILVFSNIIDNSEDSDGYLQRYIPTFNALYSTFNKMSNSGYLFGPSSWNVAIRIIQNVVTLSIRYAYEDVGHDVFDAFLVLLFNSIPVSEISSVVSVDALSELYTVLGDKRASSTTTSARSKLLQKLRAITATRKRKRDASNTLRPTQSVSNLTRTTSIRHDVDSQGGHDALVYVLTQWWGMSHSDAHDLASMDIQDVLWAKIAAQSASKNVSHDGLAQGIGLLPPAIAGTLMVQKEYPEKPPQCSFSDAAYPDLLSTSAVSHVATIDLALEALQVVNLNEKTQFLLLVSLRRILIHSGIQAANENWRYGEISGFVLRSLGSGSRKIRLAAGRAAHAVIIAQEAALSKGLNEVEDFNQDVLFDRFDDLLQSRNAQLAETILVSVTLIGRSIPIARLYRCLICLFRMLGNTNPLLRSLAYIQLNTLAEHNATTMYKVCSSHLPRLSVFLVLNMLSSPHMLTDSMSVLGFPDRKAFLHQTLRYTLPSLIAESKRDILSSIARTLGQPVQPLCLEYVEHILAHLYLREGSKRDEGIQLFLDEFQGSKKQINLSSVIISCGPSLLASLVMALGDTNETVAKTAMVSIDSIEDTIAEAENRKSRGKKQKYSANESFLRNHILGIMSIISDNLNDVQGRRSVDEKSRIIRSLGVLIKKIGPGIVSVSPQVMALLQAFVEVDNLRSVTLDSIKSFITTLTYKDLSPYIGRTVASFVGNWSAYTASQMEKARSILNYILDNAHEMPDQAAEMLDMKHIPELTEQQKKLTQIRSGWNFKHVLENILQRASRENSRVRLHSLIELREFISNNRSIFKSLTTGDVFDPIVGTLIKFTLSAADRSGDLQQPIQNAAFDCVGTLGAVDPDRIELMSEEKTMIIDSNFEDYDENVRFVMSLMTNELVGAYRSTSDSRAQQDLAYAIQELLKFCGFRPELLQREDNSLPLKVKQRWELFPRQVLETLSTLLTDGRYIAREPKRRPMEYPIYTKSKSYSEWLRLWTTDLIWKTRGKQASAIFSVFKPVVRNQDVGVARYILPYLVLNVLITGEDSDRNEMSQEITVILSDQMKEMKDSTSQDKRLLSAQTIFDLMDHLGKWTRKQRMNIQPFQKLAARQRPQKGGPVSLSSHQQAQLDMYTHNLDRVHPLIQSIDADLLAHAALRCRSYARSLLTFERRIFEIRSKGDEENLQLYYEHLHEIYANLDEPDGMEGVSTLIIAPSLEHQIREHESTGRWTAAQSCWEVELQKKPDDLNLHAGLLRCLRNLGHYDTLGTHIRGVLSSHPEWRQPLGSFQTEGAWIVGDWKTVRENVSSGLAKHSPEYSLGRLLLAVHDNELYRLPSILHEARQLLGTPIIAAGRDGYRRAYDSAVHLHMVHELEMISQAITQITKLSSTHQPESAQTLAAKLTTLLEDRLEVTMPTFKSREPLLSLRRSAIATSAISQEWAKNEIGALWLSSAKTARKAHHFQTAYSASLQADQIGTPFSFIQSAKLIRANGEHEKALRELDAGLEYQVPKLMLQGTANSSVTSAVIDLTEENSAGSTQTDFNTKYRRLKAKGLLLKARWLSEGDRKDFNDVVTHFNKAIEEYKTREQPYYELGHYYDTHGKQNSAADQVIAQSILMTVKYYSRALCYGTKYIYQTMPRMLTLWMDFGARSDVAPYEDSLAKPSKNDKKLYIYHAYTQTNNQMLKNLERLPSYAWYIAFAQIVSRIGHTNKSVYAILEKIMIRVLRDHPQQALWAMVGMYNSTKPKRSERCKKIVMHVQQYGSVENKKIIQEALTLVHELLSLCVKHVNQDEWTISLKRSFPRLVGLAPMNFMLPLQSSMTVSLPATNKHTTSHQPFPDRPVRVAKFVDEVELMKSLVKPRKLTIIGDNGQDYSFLCKPDDDLRKDARLMDFNSMINKFLKSNSEARKRSLYIRTYTVVPLNERCGLIEWVKDTRTFRSILTERYEYRNIKWYMPDIAALLERGRQSGPEQTIYFFRSVLKRYPKVFHEWFIEMFPEPSEWLKARMTYSRTLAVMSITGFVLGLGDRHCENILLDKNNGAVQHVDFNCLFEKGSQFEVPERVPFRLTQNLIDGLGVTGTEGVFRKAAEVTMAVLRANRDSLGSVVESFLHDPLVDWEDAKRKLDNFKAMEKSGRRPSSKKTSNLDDDPDSQAYIKSLAMSALDPIERKLQGLQTEHNKPLKTVMSTSAQVEKLIREATSPKLKIPFARDDYCQNATTIMAGLQITDEQIERYRKVLRETKTVDKYKDSWITGAFWTGIEKERFFKAVARRSRFRADLVALDVRTKSQAQCMEYINVLDYESISNEHTIEQEMSYEISERFEAVEDVFHRFLIQWQILSSNERARCINYLAPTSTTDVAFRSAQKNRRYRLKKKGLSLEEIEDNLVIDPHNSKDLLIGQTLKKMINRESIDKDFQLKVEEVLKKFLRPLLAFVIAGVEARIAFMGTKHATKKKMMEVVTGDVDIALAVVRGTGPKEALDYEKRDRWLSVESQAPPTGNLKKWIPLSKMHFKHHETQAKMLDQYPFSTFQSDALLPMNLPLIKKPHSYHKVYEDLLLELDDDADLEDEFEEYDREYEEALLKKVLEGTNTDRKRTKRESTSPIADVKRPRLDLAAFEDESEDGYDDAMVLADLKGEPREGEEENEQDEEEEEDTSTIVRHQEENQDGEGNVKKEHDYDLEMYDDDEIVDSDLDSVEGIDLHPMEGVAQSGEEGENGNENDNENEDGDVQITANKHRLTSGYAINWIDYGV
ncbi:hypothetical protein E3P81_01253 [Wallemia ichthyophaga]|nr:hypothetical protein E3P97_01254 [Wallemia ichthyophaga]TIB34183.1 hypothetical protein E3P85_01003 [Wallemia ichthyophaga]TIB48557.1 hypothetical protein E3P82_01252 [Wallemia ichthyophaga]TIB52595.1 hypothetical protein E3P81_01253 [Wallemia ichthyophaga]TIB55302.1 hypothetical protein E3P80_01253 [Wallemia ichthyophaga]